MKPSISRRNYFIKKDLQGRFVLSYFLLVVIGSLVFAAILALFSADTFTMVYDHHNLELGRTWLVLFKRILGAHWVFIVAGGLAVTVIAILLTHRVAGPMYRFEQTLDEMTRGNIGLTARLRDGDEGRELAEKINEFNSMLSARLSEMRGLAIRADILMQTLAAGQEASGGPNENTTTATLAEARAAIKQLQDTLDGFQLKKQ